MLEVRCPCTLSDNLVELYETAFPEEEKIFLTNLYRTVGRGGRFFTFHDRDVDTGFCFLYEGREAVFLVYLATDPGLRNKGYGAEMLKKVKEAEKGRKMFLVLEPPKGDEGDALRARRKGFYLRNGFIPSKGRLLSDGVWFEAMSSETPISVGLMQETVFEYERVHGGNRIGDQDCSERKR